MGIPKQPKRVKLIIGMLAKDKKLFDVVEEFFIKGFGDIDCRGPLIPFSQTDYYKKEMGEPLKKRFISFKKPILPENLAKIKLATNAVEKKLSVKKNGLFNRRINLDPGYISESKLVLATTKDYSHRIYLGGGIYAEVTLTWKKGGFQPLEWTYPDYRTDEYLKILNEVRNAYAEQIKSIPEKT